MIKDIAEIESIHERADWRFDRCHECHSFRNHGIFDVAYRAERLPDMVIHNVHRYAVLCEECVARPEFVLLMLQRK